MGRAVANAWARLAAHFSFWVGGVGCGVVGRGFMENMSFGEYQKVAFAGTRHGSLFLFLLTVFLEGE